MVGRTDRAWWLVCVLAAGCRGETATDGASSTAVGASTALIEAADDQAEPDAGTQLTGTAARAGERANVPAGKLVAGSEPGDRGRDPSLEPALLELDVGAFSLDRLPYPNDPAQPPKVGVSRPEAARLCVNRGGRLCSEVEWERACKGPQQQAYGGGRRFSGRCSSAPNSCASAFGVLAMGFALREWTASDVLPIKGVQPRAAAVRGARRAAADVDHRCAHRAAVASESRADDLGFRCCYGDPPTAQLASPKWRSAFAKADLPPERLAQLFASNRRLAPLAKDIKYFRREAAIDTILRRGRAHGGDAGAPPAGVTLTTAPTWWNPIPGEQILLVTGRSERRSFIVAFHHLGGDRYRVGATFIMNDETGPVVLIYDSSVRRRLHWATCWQCYGDTGNISYRDDHRVVITQK